MRLIAHRGLHDQIDMPGNNWIEQFEHAFKVGLDVEVDVRFHGMEVYCSHDPMVTAAVKEGRYAEFKEFCSLLADHPDARAFVNVKCDGMTSFIRESAMLTGVLDRIVTFDHSMPDWFHAEKHQPDVQRCVRAGVFEGAIGVRVKNKPWVWLDPVAVKASSCVPFLVQRIKRYSKVNEGARIVIVSPDIHHPDPQALAEVNMPGFAWEISRLPAVYGILTDRPTLFGFKP